MLLSERWTKDTEFTDSKQKRLIGTLCGKKLSGLFSKQSSLLSRPADRPADICLKMTFTLWRWKFKIFSLYFFSDVTWKPRIVLFKNGILWLYLPDCEMPSFGQACSITIPMNTSLQWKIALETIPRLKCSLKRIVIAMALCRKIKHADKVPVIRCLINRWYWVW